MRTAMPRAMGPLVSATLLLATLAARHAEAVPPKSVLVLLAESTEMPSLAVTVREVVGSLRATAGGPLNMVTESLERSRFPQDDRRLVTLLQGRYASAPPDLVLAISAPAVEFALRHRDELFRDVPLVYAFVDERMAEGIGTPARTTGVAIRADFVDLVELALRLHPRARRLVVVGGVSEFDRGWQASFRQAAPQFEGRVGIRYLTESSLPELLGELATLPGDSLILYISMSRDSAGTAFVPRDVLDMIRRVSTVPIYGPSQTYVGHGAIGGPVMDFEAHGRDVGRIAGRLLAGEPVSSVRPEVSSGRVIFDWREMKRFAVAEDMLPAGAAVLFRESEWAINKGWIIAVAVLVVAQTALIVALGAQRRKRAAVQRDLDDRLEYGTLLSEVSTALNTVPLRGLDATIRSVLERIRQYFDTDIVAILDVSSGPPAHRVADPSGVGAPAVAAARSLVETALGTVRLASFQPLVLESAADLPRDATPERMLLREAGIRSIAMVGMDVGRQTLGVLCCLSRTREATWPAGRQQQLRALSEVIANALQRQQTAEAVAESDRLRGSILSSISAQIAVLDRQGTIIAVNEAWRDSGRVNGVRDQTAIGPGANYLDVCRRAAAERSPGAAEALAGIESVCGGRAGVFEHEYQCQGPGSVQWFSMKVVTLRRAEGGAVVTHREVTAEKRQALALRELGGRLIRAQEDERRRIARELHDDLQQRLALLAIELDGLALGRPLAGREDFAASARRLWTRTNEISSEIHRISHRLLPLKLETLGLLPTIDGYCREVSEQGVRTVFTHSGVPASVPDDVALCLFRVIQEALRNVVKHSGSAEARVSLTGRDDGLHLIVADAGRGFDAGSAMAGRGLGLASMHERLRLVGGDIRVESAVGSGARIEVRIPSRPGPAPAPPASPIDAAADEGTRP